MRNVTKILFEKDDCKWWDQINNACHLLSIQPNNCCSYQKKHFKVWLMLINIFKWVTDLSTIWNVCRIDFKDKLKKNYKLQHWLQFILTESASFQQTNHVELILIFYTRLQQESYDCIQHTSPITFSTSQTFGNIFNSKFPSFFFLSAKTMKRYLIAEHLLAFSLLLCGPARAKWSQLGDHCSSQSNSPYRAFFFGGVFWLIVLLINKWLSHEAQTGVDGVSLQDVGDLFSA